MAPRSTLQPSLHPWNISQPDPNGSRRRPTARRLSPPRAQSLSLVRERRKSPVKSDNDNRQKSQSCVSTIETAPYAKDEQINCQEICQNMTEAHNYLKAVPVPNRPKPTNNVNPSPSKNQQFYPALVNDQKVNAPENPTDNNSVHDNEPEKDMNTSLPQYVQYKVLRELATKKRVFLKMRKTLIPQQNVLLETYAQLRDIETRIGSSSIEELGEVRVVSVAGWPAYDLLLLIRDDIVIPANTDIEGRLGTQVMAQVNAQLNPVPDQLMEICMDIMDHRMELLELLRGKQRGERSACFTVSAAQKNSEWKTKTVELDKDTENLQRKIVGAADNLKAKINHTLNLFKIPWIDRETLIKKIERVQKEKLIMQHKIEEQAKKEQEGNSGTKSEELSVEDQNLLVQLAKEKAEREALKEVVSTAESMLRVARTRISNLERELKESRADAEAARRKQKELEQLYRNRETNYDARSKKLMEVSKTGEITIETLSRQRDVLEDRVKELHELSEEAERRAKTRQAELEAQIESLQAKLAEQHAIQEKVRTTSVSRTAELEEMVKKLENELSVLRERSEKLLEIKRSGCLEFVPAKEREPSDMETKLWKELQATRAALARVQDELQQARADKDSFLNSLSRIAQEEQNESGRNKRIAKELLDREHKISRLQMIIDEQKQREMALSKSMTEYQNQVATLRLEVLRLHNSEYYSKEPPFPDMQAVLFELQSQVEKLKRERSALVTAAATRGLMLEHHERAADLFASTVRARRELVMCLHGQTESLDKDRSLQTEVPRSLTNICASAAQTWSALQAERARVLQLESAVLAQSQQLQRESHARTQLEQRRALLERYLLRAQSHTTPSNESQK